MSCARTFSAVWPVTRDARTAISTSRCCWRGTRPTLEGLQTGLADALSEAAGRTVDLVVLNHAPPDLVHRVLRDGVLLLERDRSARIRFEVKARNEYFDLLPYLREYRRRSRGQAA